MGASNARHPANTAITVAAADLDNVSFEAVRPAVRREHGDKFIAAMPTKFLRVLLDPMEPTTAARRHPRADQRGTTRNNREVNREINTGLANPRIKARIADLGSVPMPLSPTEFSTLLADETEKWGKVIRAAGIKAE